MTDRTVAQVRALGALLLGVLCGSLLVCGVAYVARAEERAAERALADADAVAIAAARRRLDTIYERVFDLNHRVINAQAQLLDRQTAELAKLKGRS
jgi:hypothetical protein